MAQEVRMQTARISEEVFVARDRIVKVARRDVTPLKELAARSRRRRARLCAHPSAQAPLHEMLIVLDRSTYVRPHRHPGKSESFHVVEGAVTVVVFADDGRVEEVIPMGDYQSGRMFYYRLQEAAYHTVLLEADVAVIHETTNGPFEVGQTEFAPWAPPEDDETGGQAYVRDLARRLAATQSPEVRCP
jgi:cupin fold WbuC family metalloprotein